MYILMFVLGLIGFDIGRFPGLIVGAALGYWLAKKSGRFNLNLQSGLAQAQSQYMESTFAVMGAMCKADGRITPEEIQAAEALFDRFRLSPEKRERAKQAFNRGKAPDFDLDAELRKVMQLTHGHRVLLQMFLQVQLTAIAADGQMHPAEHQMLLRVARGLGLTDAEVRQLEAMLRGASAQGAGAGQTSSRQQVDDAYEVLGVSPSDSDEDIKKAYRRLMSQNHPDKLASKGLPESMREMAEQKTREITHAYDVIKAARASQ